MTAANIPYVDRLDYMTCGDVLPVDFITKFRGLVRPTYSDLMTAGHRLQQLLAEFTVCVVEDVCGLEGWSALLIEVPDYATDLDKQMTNRIG